MNKHKDHIFLGNRITRDIFIHIKPRSTITTKSNCYLFLNQNDWYPCQTISLVTKENNDIPTKKHFEPSKQSIHPQKQLEENEDHDVKRNGKNRQELGGNGADPINNNHPRVRQKQLGHNYNNSTITQLYSKINQQIKGQTIYLHQTLIDMNYIQDIDSKKEVN